MESLPFQTRISFFLRDPVRVRRRLEEELDYDELRLYLTVFFTNALRRHGNFNKSFQSVDIMMDPSFDAETGQVIANVTGIAQFRGLDIPTEKELEDIVRTYFTFFGTEDLDSFLKNSYPDKVVSGLALEIRGTKLESDDADRGATQIKNNDDDDDDDDDGANVGLIVGIVVGGLAFIVLAGVTLRYRNKMSKQPVERGLVLDDEDTTMNPGATPPRMGAPPRRMFANPQPREISPPPPMPPNSDMMSTSEQDARSLSGMISLEESLFTTDNESYARPTTFQYDASRLDQVISSAKGYAQGLDGDTDDEALL
jgi:hypothetical protein